MLLPLRFQKLFLVLLMFPALLMAGGGDQPTGARRIALGNAFTGVYGDVWSSFSNPAALTGLESIAGGLHAERRFLVNKLNYGSFAAAVPFKERHVAGLDFSGFGFAGYSESRIGLSYAAKVIENFSIGVRANYSTISIENYGSASALFVDAGLHARVSEELSVGFRVYNANQGELRREISERIPTILSVGAAWKVSDKVLLVGDLEKSVDFPFSVRGGLEYAFIKNFKARIGVQTAPVIVSAGLGFNIKGVDIDFANSYHQNLGYTPHFTLSYRFNRGRNEQSNQ